jgi:hypothetical protein
MLEGKGRVEEWLEESGEKDESGEGALIYLQTDHAGSFGKTTYAMGRRIRLDSSLMLRVLKRPTQIISPYTCLQTG